MAARKPMKRRAASISPTKSKVAGTVSDDAGANCHREKDRLDDVASAFPVASPLKLYLGSIVLKLLLAYTYTSTDLDVHTNWMAITYGRPFKDWYSDGASPSVWTLDYPPFFAWFEYGLASIAALFPSVRPFLHVDGWLYAECGRHTACVLFQRCSVICSEFVLFAAVYFATMRESRRAQCLAVFLVLFHPGLLIVDHVHFQYNGLLMGLLVISTTLASSGNDVLATVAFSMTLCFKHLFLYVAPAFGCYYLGVLWSVDWGRRVGMLVRQGLAAVAVVGAAFGPVVASGMTEQVVKRLFPLQRGLIHSYWAPNAWALYAAADKVLGITLPGGYDDGEATTAAFTGGLVQVTKFRVLPQVDSGTTAVVTLVAMLPALLGLLRRPLPGSLWRAVVYCSLCSFMFGYHVHEKAILMTLIPLAVVVAKMTPSDVRGDERDRRDSRERGRFMFLSMIGTYSLFPLLTGVEEYVPKVALLVGYAIVARVVLGDGGLSRLERVFCTWGVAAVEVYATFVHGRVFGEAWPFVPLMLVSVYCAVGVGFVWAQFCMEFLFV